VPGAVGNQTNGSIVRPAAFCGVVGFKPTFGLIPRTGILPLSGPLDTVGTFARTIEDAALLAWAMAGYDPGDPDTQQASPANLHSAFESPPTESRIAFVRSPVWGEAEQSTQQTFLALAAELGSSCDEADLPEAFGEAVGAHRILMIAGIARNLRAYADDDALSAYMRATIDEGRGIAAVDYLAALDCRAQLGAAIDKLFEPYDAILTPAAPAEAPIGLETTGSPIFCTLWTLIGMPAISLPLLRGPHGMPLGVQLVGRRHGDGRLLRAARWLTERLAAR
jgi:Asp-tRNA(Asn)/Glu-tRNA(Gln) amidotransferase A subunit family amidase